MVGALGEDVELRSDLLIYEPVVSPPNHNQTMPLQDTQPVLTPQGLVSMDHGLMQVMQYEGSAINHCHWLHVWFWDNHGGIMICQCMMAFLVRWIRATYQCISDHVLWGQDADGAVTPFWVRVSWIALVLKASCYGRLCNGKGYLWTVVDILETWYLAREDGCARRSAHKNGIWCKLAMANELILFKCVFKLN